MPRLLKRNRAGRLIKRNAMQTYKIVDWKRRFEVTKDKCRVTADTPLENLRQKRHDFIMQKVFGHVLGPGYRTIVEKAWRAGENNELAVIGMFTKLCEIAGDQDDPKHRGWILDHNQQPMNIKQIAELLNIQAVGRFRENLMILIEDVNWVEICEYPVNCAALQNLQGDAKIAEAQAPSGDDCNLFKDESESEYNINNNEKGLQKNDSILLQSDSDSDSKKINLFLLGLSEIVHNWTDTDHTTFRNIAKHITAENFDYVQILDDIRQHLRRPGIQNRKAVVTDFCKQKYGFEKTVTRYKCC